MNTEQRIEELEMIRTELGSLIERLENAAKGDQRESYYEAYLIPSLKIACGEMGFSDQDANLSTWIQELRDAGNDDPEGLRKLVDELETQMRYQTTMDHRARMVERHRLEKTIGDIILWWPPRTEIPSWIYHPEDLPEIRARVEAFLEGEVYHPGTRFPGQTQNFSSAEHPHAK